MRPELRPTARHSPTALRRLAVDVGVVARLTISPFGGFRVLLGSLPEARESVVYEAHPDGSLKIPTGQAEELPV